MLKNVNQFTLSPHRKTKWIAFAMITLSAALFLLALPPQRLGFLGWFALVPLFLASRRRTRRELYPLTFLWSMMVIIGCSDAYFWKRSEVFVIIILAGILVQGIVVAEILLFRQKFLQWGWLMIPSLWASGFFLMGYSLSLLPHPLPPTIPFISISNSQWLYPAALQVLSITGELGLVFLIILVNSGLTEGIHRLSDKRSWLSPIILSLGLVVICLAGGSLYLSRPSDPGTMGTAIVPAGSYLELNPSLDITRELVAALDNQPLLFPDGTSIEAINLIAWDESPVGYLEDEDTIESIRQFARDIGAYLVVDVFASQPSSPSLNVALIFAPDGIVLAQNAKRIIPMIVEENSPGDRSRAPETAATPWGTMTTLICYETFFPDLVRRIARHDIDFFVVPAKPPIDTPRFTAIHLSQTIFRAAENHTAIAFSYSSGISALIDSYGRLIVHSPLPSILGHTEVATAIIGPLSVEQGGSFYTRTGDAFAWGLSVLSVSLVLAGRRKEH
jgi:apolipoprotein N-acyltransferase